MQKEFTHKGITKFPLFFFLFLFCARALEELSPVLKVSPQVQLLFTHPRGSETEVCRISLSFFHLLTREQFFFSGYRFITFQEEVTYLPHYILTVSYTRGGKKLLRIYSSTVLLLGSLGALNEQTTFSYKRGMMELQEVSHFLFDGPLKLTWCLDYSRKLSRHLACILF